MEVLVLNKGKTTRTRLVEEASSVCIKKHATEEIISGRKKYRFCRICAWEHRRLIWPKDFENN